MIYEDEHLLVVNKPAGWNTHAPSPYAGEGIYDWLRAREPRWASLAILHRLDKETSGVLVFGKTTDANRSLTEQFTQRTIQKRYIFITDRAVKQPEVHVKTCLIRSGEKYVCRPLHPGGEVAETRFRILADKTVKGLRPGQTVLEAEPVTGRTHQIRVHAAHSGFPILGDTLYGGTSGVRVCLHAAELCLKHPATNKVMKFQVPADFDADSRQALRSSLVESEQTNAFRLVHGAADGWPGWYVDRLGDYLLSQSEAPVSTRQRGELNRFMDLFQSLGVYHKPLNRQVRGVAPSKVSPQLILGRAAPDRFTVCENGVSFELSFKEGYSVGLFLDQRDNRRRFANGYIATGFSLTEASAHTLAGKQVLNTFAYACGFSVCAARAGAKVTSLDLSKKYLEWGRRNFALNGLDASSHDFIFGDAFDWMRRLARKGRTYDIVILDPPTFSQSREHGTFRVEKDFGELVGTALSMLVSGGVLLASTNSADWPPEKFISEIERAVAIAGRKIVARHYAPQPPDFPISRTEPAYLKTIWLRID